jgi:hypothetical protein
MNARTLKWIAMITMTIDHIGYWLITDPTWYLLARSIGRLSFPIFCFLIAEGYKHTRSVPQYLMRIGAFALGIEGLLFVYFLISGENYVLTESIFLPLSLGLLALILIHRKEWYLKLLVIPLAWLAGALNMSYGTYGIAMILLFGVIKGPTLRFLGFLFLSFFFIQLPLVNLTYLFPYAGMSELQWLAVAAMIPISLYNGKPGPKGGKWFFYIYYPVHILVLAGIKMAMDAGIF